jgi:hypothetical protein
MKNELIPMLFRKTAEADLGDMGDLIFRSLYWWIDEDTNETTFSVNVSDVFHWGCADAEDINTEEDIDLFIQSIKDHWTHGDVLYACRKRRMRPQGAMYRSFRIKHKDSFDEPDERLIEMINKCGPEREINIGNPYNEKNEYLYKEEK